MKKVWKKRFDDEAVSPVIAVILMVAITVVLAAVLYVTVQQMAETGSEVTPKASMTRTEDDDYPGNYTVAIADLSTNVKYKDVYLTITTPTGVLTIGSAEDGMQDSVAASGTAFPTGLDATNVIYSKIGTSKIGAGDSLRLTATLGADWSGCQVKMIYIPTNGLIGQVTL